MPAAEGFKFVTPADPVPDAGFSFFSPPSDNSIAGTDYGCEGQRDD